MSIIYAQINENGQFDAFTNAPIEGWYEIKNPPQEMLDCSIRFQPDGQGGIEKISDEDFKKLYPEPEQRMSEQEWREMVESALQELVLTQTQGGD